MPHISRTGNASGRHDTLIANPGVTPTPTERWLPIIGFLEYEASDFGRVRHIEPGRPILMLRGSLGRSGYRRVVLYAAGQRKTCSVARLVAAAFIGAPLPGMEVNHRNLDRADNRLANLEYITPAGNKLHARLVARKVRCVNCGSSAALHGPDRIGGCVEFRGASVTS